MKGMRGRAIVCAAALVVASVGAYASSNGGRWLPTHSGSFVVHCGAAAFNLYDCGADGYCKSGDSWCQQECKDNTGQLTNDDNLAVQVMCVGVNGDAPW